MKAEYENRLLTKTSALALAMGAGLSASGADAAVQEGVFDPIFFGAVIVGDNGASFGNPSVDLDFTLPTAPGNPASEAPQAIFFGISGINASLGIGQNFSFNSFTLQNGSKAVGYEVPVDPNDPTVKAGSYAKALGEGEVIGEARTDFIDGSFDPTNSGAGVILSKAITGLPDSPDFKAGDFCAPGGAFIGMQFDINGDTHYGWVEAQGFDNCMVALRRYAYETEAGASITTPELLAPLDPIVLVPEPASLAILASGALGIAVMRRRQRQR
jgi:hypothetical protein